MVLLIATMYGVRPNEVAALLESSGRCRWRPLSPIIQSDLDTFVVERFGLMGFDFNFENHTLFHKKINKSQILIIPARPDLIWDRMEARYGDRTASAFCNRMKRLRELSARKSLTIPYEELGSGSSLLALQNFLGFTKSFVSDWQEPTPAVDCLMQRRYAKDLSKMSGQDSWYMKHTSISEINTIEEST